MNKPLAALPWIHLRGSPGSRTRRTRGDNETERRRGFAGDEGGLFMEKLDRLYHKMLAYDAGDAKRIQHFIKVHSLTALIARGEGLDPAARQTLEAAALVHDIGIHPAEQLYGSCGGKYQEELGPAPARALALESGFDAEAADRIAWLVGHHHTYSGIDDLDHRILVEADFLVNLYEEGTSPDGIRHAYEKIFRTATGRRLCRMMFGMT